MTVLNMHSIVFYTTGSVIYSFFVITTVLLAASRVCRKFSRPHFLISDFHSFYQVHPDVIFQTLYSIWIPVQLIKILAESCSSVCSFVTSLLLLTSWRPNLETGFMLEFFVTVISNISDNMRILPVNMADWTLVRVHARRLIGIIKPVIFKQYELITATVKRVRDVLCIFVPYSCIYVVSCWC